ncbi:MFS transporter [Leptolyngbya sp. 15MV]|nr:MFS transporter [Leptolyngbya sp. 15MV]
MITRRLALGTLLLPAIAHAQTFPDQPVRVIVPFAPGGPVDIIARLVTRVMAERLGRPIVIESRAGAGGLIGVDAAAKARPDGHTLVMSASGAVTILPHLQPNMPYDAMRDLAPITQVFAVPQIVSVAPQLGIRTLAELIARARAQPGQLTFGSAGIGSSLHMAGELLKLRTGTEITHVPYRGAAVGEDHRADVPPIQHRAPNPRKVALPSQQRGADLRQHRDGRRRGIGLRPAQIGPLQIGRRQRPGLGRRHHGIARIAAAIQHAPPDRAIQQPRIQVRQPEFRREPPRQRALSRRRRAIHRDDEGFHTGPMAPSGAPLPTSPFTSAAKPGKEVSMKAASSTATGARAASPSTSALIAMRWSICVTTVPPPAGGPPAPSTTRSSPSIATRTPLTARSAAVAARRSLSLTRSSFSPRIRVVPRAAAATTARIGYSSIIAGARSGGTSTPRSVPARMRRSATGSPPSVRSPVRAMSAPISASVAKKPARSGFIPTPRSTMSDPGTSSAAAAGNAAEEGSPGTMPRGCRREAGCRAGGEPAQVLLRGGQVNRPSTLDDQAGGVDRSTPPPVQSPGGPLVQPVPDVERGRERLLRILSAGTFLIFFQAYMVAPLIPRLSAVFGVSEQAAGLAVPAYLIPYGVATLFYGILSDRIGRRVILLSSLGAFVLVTALTATARSAHGLVAWRLVTGLGASGVVPLALALMGTLFPYEQRGRPLGWLFGAMAGGAALGSTVGVMLEPFVGWRALFLGVSALGAVVLILLVPYRALLGAAPPGPPAPVGAVLAGFGHLLATPRGARTYGFVLWNALFHSGVFTWLGVYFQRRYGLGEVGIGLALAGYGVPGFLLGPVIGSLADRYGRPVAHLHLGQAQLRQAAGERGELVEMGREDGPAADAVVQGFQHGPGDGEPIPGGGAAADLVQHHQAARRGAVQDRGGLGHLDHEGGTAPGDVVAAADPAEQPVHETEAGRVRRHKQPGLGEHHDQRVLPQPGGFAGHVGAGEQAEAAAGRQVAIIRHEGRAPGAAQRGFHHGMAAAGDAELRAVGELRPAPAALGRQRGGRGVQVELADRLRGGGDRRAGIQQGAAQVGDAGALPRGGTVPGLGHLAVQLGQRLAGEAHGVRHGLAVDGGVIGRDGFRRIAEQPFGRGGGKLGQEAELLVVPDLQARHAPGLGEIELQRRDRLPPAIPQAAQRIEFAT